MTNPSRSPFVIAPPGPPDRGRAVIGDAAGGASPVERVERMVRCADVFVFMKGTPARPACGFSASTVAMLDALGARYSSFDVLSDESIRAAAKEVAQWPTFPQVWVRGELIGGNDIVGELYRSGELAQLLGAGR